jgi:tetratricopeptide (TPR) repeat protein
MALLKLGFALYDAERYRDALAVFQKMGQCRSHAALALVWEGHMLDLLGKRAEAIARYEKASGMPVSGQHSQYGLVLSPDYVAHRIRTPFTRVENREED